MARLTIHRNGEIQYLEFHGEARLTGLLERAGHSGMQPCGGRGVCGKCAVMLTGHVSEPNEAEQKAGMRLACQTAILGDAEVYLPEARQIEQIETCGALSVLGEAMAGKLGAAIDLGTTTIALQVYDLKTGKLVGQAAVINPQTSVAADVMGRIDAAMNGRLRNMQDQALQAIQTLLFEAAGDQAADVDVLVVTGNTTMLYLLTGRDPSCLSHAPFLADTLFGICTELLGYNAYLPACMNAFVGADISCAVLACKMCETQETSLLCDIGTNGEIALWKDGALYVTATAAGPAFEGAGISCGCSSVRGAVDRVWVKNGELQVHTIGDTAAVGVCGSGLIDTVAALRKLGIVNRTGAATQKEVEIADGVRLLQKDIREVQLAKAAIAAGIKTLVEVAGATLDEIETVYIAGGFGSHLSIESAVAVGLLPEQLSSNVRVVGNAALAGAVQLMMDQNDIAEIDRIVKQSKHINLGGNPVFSKKYMEEILFP